MDGIYQAVASGVNLTGVFSFQIAVGSRHPTQNVTLNSWVFFVDGNIFQGSVVAAISQTKVAGVLNGATANLPIERRWQLITFPPHLLFLAIRRLEIQWVYFVEFSWGAFSGDGVLRELRIADQTS